MKELNVVQMEDINGGMRKSDVCHTLGFIGSASALGGAWGISLLAFGGYLAYGCY